MSPVVILWEDDKVEHRLSVELLWTHISVDRRKQAGDDGYSVILSST